MSVEIAFELPYTEWGWRVGIYIALIGIASGAYLMGYVADLRSWRRGEREHGNVAKYGYLIGLVGLVIGPPVLLSHLATPFRAMMIPLTMTNLGSWMAIGSYMLMGFGLGTFLMFVWVAFGRERPHSATVSEGGEDVAADGGRDVASDGGGEDAGPARAATEGDTSGGIRGVFSRVGLLGTLDSVADRTRPTETVRLAIGALFGVFAAGVLVYSAMAYGSGPTARVPLWDPIFLLPMQILSGLGAGLTAAVGLAAIEERSVGRTIQQYALAAAGLLTATLVVVVATLLYLPVAVEGSAPAVENLLTIYAGTFVGGALLLGLVVPIALLVGGVYGERRDSISPTAATASYAAAGLLVVVGKVALALSYLMAAEFMPMPLPM